MTKEMVKFRQMLDENGIEWKDASSPVFLPMWRTHFHYRGYEWSVIHGYGSYGGYSRYAQDEGLLELMSCAVNNGDPVGRLTAEDAMKLVLDGAVTERSRR